MFVLVYVVPCSFAAKCLKFSVGELSLSLVKRCVPAFSMDVAPVTSVCAASKRSCGFQGKCNPALVLPCDILMSGGFSGVPEDTGSLP